MPKSHHFTNPDNYSLEPPVPCDFRIGDVVTVTNGYGIKIPGRRVIGFVTKVDPEFLPDHIIYLDWDCYWAPVKASDLKLDRRDTEAAQ